MNLKTAAKIGVAIAVAIQSGSSQGEWENALKPEGKQGETIAVVTAGKAAGGIQLPARPTPQEKKAAGDLQHWIREMTGATLEIVPGKGAPCCIAIRTDLSPGDEGCRIAVRKGQIVLSGGRTRGPINAVYALLEEDLGCRFYTRDSIRIPKTDTLAIAPVARQFVPQLKVRDPYYKCAFDPEWSLRNRTNAPEAKVPEEHGGHMDYAGMFVHTAAQLVPVDKYFKEHPDYFGLQPDGKRHEAVLCATHPEVAKIAIAHVREVLKKNPAARILSVSKNDIPLLCHCDRCTKLRDSEGSDLANQLCLVNKVAEAIESEYPHVAIDTLAYLETINVPKTARPRKNVVIRLCNDNVGSWVHPFTPAEEMEVAKLAGAWSAVQKRIYIWDYNVNFSHYLAPMPNLDVIAANIRFWTKHHAEGVMLQGGYEGPAEQDELKCWVASKLLWDPSRDEKALARDFIWGHYGKAAPALLEHQALLEGMRSAYPKEMAAPKDGIRYPMDSPFITKEFVTSATAVLARAKQLAGDDETLIRRVERAELPTLYVQCVRGPEFTGGAYANVVADFERIARRENVQRLREAAADLEEKLAEFKKRIPKSGGAK